jgi:hypothetical protein
VCRTITLICISALAAGCSGPPSIKVDLYREIQAQGISFYFCPPQHATQTPPCDFQGSPFEFIEDLHTSVTIDVPSGHSPVPMALVGDTSTPPSVCQAVTVDLDPSGQVGFNASVTTSGLSVTCSVCESNQAGCPQYMLP